MARRLEACSPGGGLAERPWRRKNERGDNFEWSIVESSASSFVAVFIGYGVNHLAHAGGVAQTALGKCVDEQRVLGDSAGGKGYPDGSDGDSGYLEVLDTVVRRVKVTAQICTRNESLSGLIPQRSPARWAGINTDPHPIMEARDRGDWYSAP